jgi:hypothetical protein
MDSLGVLVSVPSRVSAGLMLGHALILALF